MFDGVVQAGLTKVMRPVVAGLDRICQLLEIQVEAKKLGPIPAVHQALAGSHASMIAIDPYLVVDGIYAAEAAVAAYATTGSDEAHDALMPHMVALQGRSLSVQMAMLNQLHAITGLFPDTEQMGEFQQKAEARVAAVQAAQAAQAKPAEPADPSHIDLP